MGHQTIVVQEYQEAIALQQTQSTAVMTSPKMIHPQVQSDTMELWGMEVAIIRVSHPMSVSQQTARSLIQTHLFAQTLNISINLRISEPHSLIAKHLLVIMLSLRIVRDVDL